MEVIDILGFLGNLRRIIARFFDEKEKYFTACEMCLWWNRMKI